MESKNVWIVELEANLTLTMLNIIQEQWVLAVYTSTSSIACLITKVQNNKSSLLLLSTTFLASAMAFEKPLKVTRKVYKKSNSMRLESCSYCKEVPMFYLKHGKIRRNTSKKLIFFLHNEKKLSLTVTKERLK